jgi:surface antigen
MGTYANSFAPANCTWGAASMKGDITWSGNANEWDDAARAQGKTVSDVPIVGAVAETDRGYYGHVAVVTNIDASGVWITEMNYDGNGGVRTRLAGPGEFVYIYV